MQHRSTMDAVARLSTSLSYVVALVTVTLMTSSVAYRTGPPIEHYPEICDNMSPEVGHDVSAQMSTAPFELKVVTTDGCYSHADRPIVVKLLSRTSGLNRTTYFEGFFVQARPAGSQLPSKDYNYGQFDINGDNQLQTLSCPGSTNNGLAQWEANRYYEKTFTWKPSSSLTTTVQLVATVVHERSEYWMLVKSPELRYSRFCYYSSGGSLSLASTSVLVLVLVLVLESAWL